MIIDPCLPDYRPHGLFLSSKFIGTFYILFRACGLIRLLPLRITDSRVEQSHSLRDSNLFEVRTCRRDAMLLVSSLNRALFSIVTWALEVILQDRELCICTLGASSQEEILFDVWMCLWGLDF